MKKPILKINASASQELKLEASFFFVACLLFCFVWFSHTVLELFLCLSTKLNLNSPNSVLVFFLALVMICVDCAILYSLVNFKHVKTSHALHITLLLGNLITAFASCLPLFWEANTDSSFAMFVLYKSTSVFWIYAAIIGLSLSLGAIMLAPCVVKRHVVFVQAVMLIVSDVPMFLAGYFGLPIGVLTNTCVNILFAGLGVKLHAHYEQAISFLLKHQNVKKFTQSPPVDAVPALFGFLAVSRCVSWAVASVYGPTNWCASINPNFACALGCVLCAVWLYASGKLLSASLNPTKDERFIPFEPILVYTRLVHPYMVVLGTFLNLKKVAWYRKTWRAVSPFLNRNNVWHLLIARTLTHRLSVIYAVLNLSMPHETVFNSVLLNPRDRRLAVLSMAKIPVDPSAGTLVWKLLGNIGGIISLTGVGVSGAVGLFLEQNAQNFDQLTGPRLSQWHDIDRLKLTDLERKHATMCVDSDVKKVQLSSSIHRGNVLTNLGLLPAVQQAQGEDAANVASWNGSGIRAPWADDIQDIIAYCKNKSNS